MTVMSTQLPVVARSPRLVQAEMLKANRFLGLHQAWWGLILTPVLVVLAKLFTLITWEWWWLLPAFVVSWLMVELVFLPRRLVIRRLAAEESRAEVVRLAWQHGVALRDIKVVDREP